MEIIPFRDFVARREQEKHWLNLNGFENADPETNGEYQVLDRLAAHSSLFVDIGANVGIFLQRIAKIKKGLRCMAFEPNPFIQDELKKNAAGGAEIFPVALSNAAGDGAFYRHRSDSTTSSLFFRTEMMPGFVSDMEKISVRIETLDHYAERILEKSSGGGIFLKIDAEGSELHVLEGAQKLLGASRPIFVMFEYAYAWKESGTLLKDAFHILDRHGFSLYRLTPYGLEHARFFHPSMETYAYSNYVAVKNVDLKTIFPEVSRIPTPVTSTDFFHF